MTTPTIDPHPPNRDRKTLEEALDAFKRATGLPTNLVAFAKQATPDHRADAVIELGKEEHRVTLFAEIKTVERATMLATLKGHLDRHDGQGLLVTPYLTAELANHCRKMDLPFIDTAGNAYIHAPGLYIFIKGEKRPEHLTTMGTRGGGTATALRVVFTLLCQPDLLNAPYRDIVEAAGVALGAIGWVFFDLEKRGYVIGGKRQHNRHILEPKRLLDEWATNYPIKLRPKLNPRRLRALTADWWKDVRMPQGVKWGGEVAADRLTNYLKPAAFTIYLDPERGAENMATLVGKHRLRADPAGDIEILDKFWNLPDDPAHPDLVPPLLVYADLLATLDPRNYEVAKMIRERYLDDALRKP